MPHLIASAAFILGLAGLAPAQPARPGSGAPASQPAGPNRSTPRPSTPPSGAPTTPTTPDAPTTRGGAPATRPDAPAAAHPDITTADDLLLALETADADLSVLTADIRWFQTFALAGDMQLRWGRLAYSSHDADAGRPARRAFAIRFDGKQVGNTRPDPERIDYIFDGEWFLEKIHADHQAFRRQVVPPGDVADPLRIGEGPFPIPVGQRAAEIKARFVAELTDPVEDLDPRLVPFVEAGEGTYCLSLTPHPELLEDQTWRQIRIWYERGTLQPILAWTINAAEDESYVQLLNLDRKTPVDDAEFSTAVPREGWVVHITEWQEPARGGSSR